MQPDTQGSSAAALSAADAVAAYLRATRKTEDAEAESHILLQPEVRSRLMPLHETPIPSFIIWMPSSMQVKDIVAPFATKPRAADVTPSVSAPNEELRAANLALRSVDHLSSNKQPISGTSFPVKVQEPDLVQMTPLTVTQVSEKPTPAAVMSLSGLRMTDGVAILPPVNQSAASKTQDAPTQSRATKPSIDNDHSTGRADATRTGQGPIDKPLGDGFGPARGNGDAVGQGSQPSATLVTLAKNGHFESVVVGALLEDQFPEMEGFWNGRLLYTAFYEKVTNVKADVAAVLV